MYFCALNFDSVTKLFENYNQSVTEFIMGKYSMHLVGQI